MDGTLARSSYVLLNKKLQKAMVADYDPKTYNPEQPGLNVGMGEGNDGRPEGSHGTGYRFMPMLTVDRDTSPAVVCIAGGPKRKVRHIRIRTAAGGVEAAVSWHQRPSAFAGARSVSRPVRAAPPGTSTSPPASYASA